jgi:DNA (cytosine-5)-methyltransferase 1
MLVLSLFPGIGLLDRAFEEAGFCVVRGPDMLWGGDVKRFHPPAGRFDGIIGGPPCQAFSQLRYLVEQNGYQVAENLIPEYERVVSESAPQWFLMENVPAAPEPVVEGYGVISFLLNNRWIGGIQNRLRRFSFGLHGSACALSAYIDFEVFESHDWAYAVTSGARQIPVKIGGNGKLKRSLTEGHLRHGRPMSIADMCELQGLPREYFAVAPFSEAGKRKMVGNGVPLPMGRAIAKAVKEAMGYRP